MNEKPIIVKGYIIPKNENGKSIYAREINEEEMGKIYEYYTEFFKSFLNAFRRDVLDGSNFKDANDIKRFLDSYILYLRTLFYIDPIPSLYTSPISLLKSYIFWEKEVKENLIENLIENRCAILKRLDEFEGLMKEKLNEIEDKAKKMMDINNISIFDFPADTRVGSNTSSLIYHMLVVSAIASSIYINRNNKSIDIANAKLQTLRLASLFHDLGKMKDWHKHQTISSDFLKETMLIYCESDAKEIVEEAANIINGKLNSHTEYLYHIFKEADKLSSNTDRLQHFLLDILSPSSSLINELNKLSEEEQKKRLNNWEWWNQFTKEDIIHYTEEFCKELSNISKENKAIKKILDANQSIDEDGPLTNDIVIVRFDFSSIQRFISSSEIRVMNGASILVDTIINVTIPLYLIKRLNLPAEVYILQGGGNGTAILPSYLTEDNSLDNLCSYFKNNGFTIQYGYSYLYSSFIKTNMEIDNELLKKKISIQDISIDPIDPISLLNIWKYCKSCKKEYSVKKEDDPHNFCEMCKKKHDIGDKLHFSYRVDKLGIADNDNRKCILNYIMEYIAGSSVEEIRNGIKEYKDIALVKMDSNLLGQFMASCITFSDALERSIRIDYSLKKAFHSFLNKIREDKKGYHDRIVMGFMYMGGDDAMLLMPSVISIPFSYHMIEEYNKLMGGRSTLSVGVMVAKPKHPIQLLKDCTEYLLDDISKDKGREYASNVNECKDHIGFKGALSFFITDSSIDNKSLESIIKELERMYLTNQPYMVAERRLNLSNLIINIIEPQTHIDLLNILEDPDNVKDKPLIKDEYYKKLREFRNTLLDVLHVNIDGLHDPSLRIVYSVRKKDDSMSKIITNLLIRNDDGSISFALYDLYNLLKVMGIN